MNPSLTARQREVLMLLAQGITLRAIADRLGISESTLKAHRLELLRKFGLHTTVELRGLALRTFPDTRAPERSEMPLGHEIRLLPHIPINARSDFGAACRTLVKGRTLRDAAEYLLDLDTAPGTTPDDFRGILRESTGTNGAKQALLAAIALDSGREDLQLVVACCEMPLPSRPPTAFERDREEPRTLPMAVCLLNHNGRRIQIARAGQRSLRTLRPITDIRLPPENLANERVRLYRMFAAEWCHALDSDPLVFARLRARQLSVAASSVFEDLMGHRLPRDYAPDFQGSP